jgi:hypothetical protein
MGNSVLDPISLSSFPRIKGLLLSSAATGGTPLDLDSESLGELMVFTAVLRLVY